MNYPLIFIFILCFCLYLLGEHLFLEHRSRRLASSKLSKIYNKMYSQQNIITSSTQETKNNHETLDLEKTKYALKKLAERDNRAGKTSILEGFIKKIEFLSPEKSQKQIACEIIAFSFLSSLFMCIFIDGFTVSMKSFLYPFLGVILYRFYINIRYNRKIKGFLDNFGYAIELMIRGIRTGIVLSECFKIIAKESTPAVREQFEYILYDLQVGIPITEAMNRFEKRLPLREVKFFAVTLSVQSKTGGSLTDVLTSLSTLLRQRKSLLLKIQTLSQEAKVTAGILMGMPIAFTLVIKTTMPAYLDPLLKTDTGNYILIGCGVWMLIGTLIIRQMINFYR